MQNIIVMAPYRVPLGVSTEDQNVAAGGVFNFLGYRSAIGGPCRWWWTRLFRAPICHVLLAASLMKRYEAGMEVCGAPISGGAIM